MHRSISAIGIMAFALMAAGLASMSCADEHEHAHDEAEEAAAAAAQMPGVVITAQPVTDDIYMLAGRGGNMGLFANDAVTLLIDDQFAPLADRIVAAIAEVAERPVDYLINTHWHFDHTGGNEAFGAMGSLIIAHDNVRVRMAKGARVEAFNLDVPPAPEVALPVVTYDGTITFHIGGQTVHGRHLPNAHTDGDTVLLLQPANVLHTGDTFFHLLYPFIDLESGGSVDGLIAAVQAQLAMIDDETRVIPGHGPLATRADLADYLTMLVTVRAAVAARIDAGDDLEGVLAAKVSAAFDATANRFGFLTPDQFVTSVYQSLLAARADVAAEAPAAEE